MSMSWVTDYEALLSLQGVAEICQLTSCIIQLLLEVFPPIAQSPISNLFEKIIFEDDSL